MPASEFNAALTAIEMALKYRGATWTQGIEDNTGVMLHGIDSGRPFAIAVVERLGTPSRDLRRILAGWRKAGASTGVAYTVKEALFIVTGAGSRAS